MASTQVRRGTLLLGLALLAAATSGCGGDVVSDDQPVITSVPPSVTSAPVPPPPSTAATGVMFTAPDGRFSVEFPGSPARAQQSGGDVTFVVYGVATGGRDVSVTYADYKPADIKDQRAFVRQKLAEDGMLSLKDTTFLGRPAVDIVVPRVEAGTTRYVHERAFLVGSRMYFLRGWSSTPAATPEHARLIATFKLT